MLRSVRSPRGYQHDTTTACEVWTCYLGGQHVAVCHHHGPLAGGDGWSCDVDHPLGGQYAAAFAAPPHRVLPGPRAEYSRSCRLYYPVEKGTSLPYTPSLLAVLTLALGAVVGAIVIATGLLWWWLQRRIGARPFPWGEMAIRVIWASMIVGLAAYPLAFQWRDYRTAIRGLTQAQAAWGDWAGESNATLLQVARQPETYLMDYEVSGQRRVAVRLGSRWFTISQGVSAQAQELHP